MGSILRRIRRSGMSLAVPVVGTPTPLPSPLPPPRRIPSVWTTLDLPDVLARDDWHKDPFLRRALDDVLPGHLVVRGKGGVLFAAPMAEAMLRAVERPERAYIIASATPAPTEAPDAVVVATVRGAHGN